MLEPINGEHERDIFFRKGNRVRDQGGKNDFDGAICLGLRMYNKFNKKNEVRSKDFTRYAIGSICRTWYIMLRLTRRTHRSSAVPSSLASRRRRALDHFEQNLSYCTRRMAGNPYLLWVYLDAGTGEPQAQPQVTIAFMRLHRNTFKWRLQTRIQEVRY